MSGEQSSASLTHELLEEPHEVLTSETGLDPEPEPEPEPEPVLEPMPELMPEPKPLSMLFRSTNTTKKGKKAGEGAFADIPLLEGWTSIEKTNKRSQANVQMATVHPTDNVEIERNAEVSESNDADDNLADNLVLAGC